MVSRERPQGSTFRVLHVFRVGAPVSAEDVDGFGASFVHGLEVAIEITHFGAATDGYPGALGAGEDAALLFRILGVNTDGFAEGVGHDGQVTFGGGGVASHVGPGAFTGHESLLVIGSRADFIIGLLWLLKRFSLYHYFFSEFHKHYQMFLLLYK